MATSGKMYSMTAIEFVDVATARGVRIVVSGIAPNPWSEATKGFFRLAQVPVLAVRLMREATEITAWTGTDNVPVVLHDAEPARTHLTAIAALAARLAGPDVLIPEDVEAREETMGLLDAIAGEDGVGWNARLAMVHASVTSGGTRVFQP